MDGFLSFIFFVILGIWLLGLIGRLLLRGLVKRTQRRFAEQGGAAYQSRGSGSRKSNDAREGEVKVSQTISASKKVDRSVGEYVEFEEVEITEETTAEE